MASKQKHRATKAALASALASAQAQPVSEASLVREEERQKREDLFKHGSKYLAARRSDIIGIDGILEEADQIIDWIRNIKFYRKQDARLEPGIIFYGAPGTGKTLTARYIATETDALFIDVREWPYRGALPVASDISALFGLARDTYAEHKRPIVLFWDEFETIARDREKADPVLALMVSQITAELDGIHGKNEGLLLIGCTNALTAIDGPLKRPGRMGQHIYFRSPDLRGKAMLLRHYLTPYQTEELDYEALAGCFTTAASAAEIEEASKMAWQHSIRRAGKEKKAPRLQQSDILEVFVRRLIGHEIDFLSLTHQQRLEIAVHEVGHALAAMAWEIPLLLVTVRAGANNSGKVMTQPREEHKKTLSEHEASVRIALASRAAEKLVDIEPTDGASSDLTKASTSAEHVANGMGVGPTGSLQINSISAGRTERPSLDPEIIVRLDKAVQGVMRKAETELAAFFKKVGKKRILALAEALIIQPSLTGKDFTELVCQTFSIADAGTLVEWRKTASSRAAKS